MAIERGDDSIGRAAARTPKQASLLGSLKDALRAAGREDMPGKVGDLAGVTPNQAVAVVPLTSVQGPAQAEGGDKQDGSMSALEAARHARTIPAERVVRLPDAIAPIEPPTTRVMRHERPPVPEQETPARTQLVRGRRQIVRDTFVQDPVVGFLIIVGGPGLGASRPIFEGNNTVGRAKSNRIAFDFGDETISAEAQAYIRYDAEDRSFLFVPNLAKTNVVSVNDKRPTGAVDLKPMDIVTFGRTQVAFLPFCGPDFDWSEISGAKDE